MFLEHIRPRHPHRVDLAGTVVLSAELYTPKTTRNKKEYL